MANRSNTRDNIRRILKQHPVLDTTAASLTSSAVEMTVSAPEIYSVGDVIGIAANDSSAEELVKVIAKPEDSTKLTISRAHAGSTAKAHDSGKVIRAYPEFTDADLNQAINYSVNKTFVDPITGTHGIWILISDTTLTTSSDREYTIPSSITFMSLIEIKDSNGNYQINKRWRLSGTVIVFHHSLDVSRTIRITGMGYQSQLSDDSTSWTLADESLEFIEFCSAWHLLEWRLPDRIKATIYSAAVNDRAGQPNDILNTIAYFRRRAEDILARESKPPLSTFLLAPKR